MRNEPFSSDVFIFIIIIIITFLKMESIPNKNWFSIPYINQYPMQSTRRRKTFS